MRKDAGAINAFVNQTGFDEPMAPLFTPADFPKGNTMRCALTLACFLALSPALAADVPMFRGNPQHTGAFDGNGRTSLDGVKWTFHAKGAFVSSPAVVGDTVFIGSTDGNLYAVNRRAGTLKWKFETKGRVVSSPAVAQGMVYFASYDGNFYAVDAASGALKWQFATGGERRFAAKHLHGSEPAAETMPDPWDCYLSSPVVTNGKAIFGSGDGAVYALAAATGAVVWKFQTGEVVHASPAVANGVVYIGSWDTFFYALDEATGKEKWRFKTGDDFALHNQTGIQSSAAVADGMVFFGARDSHLYALNAASGAKVWDFSTNGSWVIASPAVRGGHVFAGTSDTGLMFDIATKTGKLLATTDLKGWPLFSSPALSGGMLYVGSMRGDVHAIDLSTHQPVWRFTTEASKKDAGVYAKADGSLDWGKTFDSAFYDDGVGGYLKLLALGAFLASPVVADNVVYIGSTDGNLYALGMKAAAK
jgi:outer membrane protein assembly factor BamB